MTEKQLLQLVVTTCQWLQLLVYHTHDSRRSQRGFPDLIIVGAGGVLWVELKSAAGRLSKEQITWEQALTAVGQTWRLWRPADWYSGAIVKELTRLAGY